MIYNPLHCIFLLLAFSNLVRCQYDDGYGGSPTPTTSIPSVASPNVASPSVSSTSSNTGGNDLSGLTGDSQCPSQLMCVKATVNGTTITYELQSKSSDMGWMALGFGDRMAGSPMVIVWPNPDGTITLSQRQASGEVMPTVVPTPPRVATLATPLSTLSGGQSKLTFTIDSSNMKSSHIWAFGTSKPGPAADSTLQQHSESGPFTLNLAKAISSNSPSSPSGTSGPSASTETPLLPYQKLIIAHAALVTFGFLFLLPLGALVARYTRTYTPRWFKAHYILQGPLGGVFVIVGCILGFVANNQLGATPPTRHKTLGIVLLALYVVQAGLGVFIHSIKISFGFRRPPQNYVHAILGLSIMALALYQVHLGYDQEWLKAGRGPVAKSVNIVWIVWAILLPVLYFAGMLYLPRQLRQESKYHAVHRTEL